MFQILSYLHYWLDCVGPHSLQGPFAFDLYHQVIESKPAPIENVERLRKELKSSEQIINFDSLGAKSKVTGKQQSVGQIVKKGNSSLKVSSLLAKLVPYLHAETIIDLGTSTGLNTAYLASTPGSQVYSFEGNKELCGLARKNFSSLGLKNIKLIEGNIDTTLPSALEELTRIDMAFIDANHRLEPTLNYFSLLKSKTHNTSVLVFDDIHWSREMQQAWNSIKGDKDVTLTIDLFQIGLVFFKKELDKEDLIIQF